MEGQKSLRVIALLVLAACATEITDEQRYARENALILAKEDFERRRRACQASGGTMVMERLGINSKRITKWEYSRAYCIKRWQHD